VVDQQRVSVEFGGEEGHVHFCASLKELGMGQVLYIVPNHMTTGPKIPATFEASKLKWEEVSDGAHAEMLEWYRALIRLRRNTPCLNDGAMGSVHVTYNEQQKWIRMERGSISIICNLGEKEKLFSASQPSSVVLASRSEITIGDHGVNLPPDTVAVLSGTLSEVPNCFARS
jgi:1,4-alpha-glucan branching enzyme